MTPQDAITPPPAVKRLVDLAIDAVWRGRRALVAQYAPPETLRGSNARAFADLGWALVRVRRLERILRYAFVTLAAWLVRGTAGVQPTGARAGAAPSQSRPAAGAAGRMAAVPEARLSLTTPVRFRDSDRVPAPQPPHLAQADRNTARTLARHIAALTHALLEPMPYIVRLARKLRRGACTIRGRAPKRPPPMHRRAHLDELDDIRAHARFELHRLRQDSS